jgi:glycosyltransferase involved in cell wall biosynthesis
MPALSVILPCYNAAETLPEALDSLSAQSFTDFEVIAVDDGSEDETGEILARRTKRDARFKHISQAHAGVAAASNAGMLASVSPYIARMDADDRSLPLRFEKQLAYLKNNPQVAVVSSLVRALGGGEGFGIYLEWVNSLVSDAEIRREIFVESPLPNPSVMFRREWLLRMGGYRDCDFPEDYDLYLRLYLAGAKFAKVPEVLLEWREHPRRLTHTDSRYSLESFLRAKAYYLALSPLQKRDAVFIWGAGMTGRRLAKQLTRRGVALAAFVDVNQSKIGGVLRGKPIIAPSALRTWWGRYQAPALLASVGSRAARLAIRQKMLDLGFVEEKDWWMAA